MAKFAKGVAVKQIVNPIVGEVGGFEIDQETGDRLIKVVWTDEEGEHARFFTEEQIELA